MSSRKRPSESRSRGHSPPEKRSRPPERLGSIHERYANPEGPTIPNQTKAKSGLRIDPNRSGTNRDITDRTLQTAASRLHGDTTPRSATPTGSIRSGGSTPVHVAPPVPSMLPKSSSAVPTNRLLQQAEASVRPMGPPAMDSFQRIREKKLAMARQAKHSNTVVNNPSTTSTSKLQAELKAQQMETAQLKKELEETSKRLEKLESSSAQSNQQGDVSARLETLEKMNLPLELASLQNKIEQVKPLSDRIDALEATVSNKAEEHQALTNEVKKVNSTLETVPHIRNYIDILKAWKETPPNAAIESQLKDMVAMEVGLRMELVKTTLKDEIADTGTRLTKRIDEDRKTVASLSSGVNISLDFKRAIEKLNLPARLANLADKVLEIEGNDIRTYNKTNSMENDVGKLDKDVEKLDNDLGKLDKDVGKLFEEFDTLRDDLERKDNRANKKIASIDKAGGQLFEELDHIKVDLAKNARQSLEQSDQFKIMTGQVQTFQGDLSTLCNDQKKLSDEQKKRNAAQDTLSSRVVALEDTQTSVVVGNTDGRLNQHDVDIKQLQQTADEFKGLTSKITEIQGVTERMSARQEQLAKDIEELDSRVPKLDLNSAEMKHIQDRLSGVETRVPNLSGVQAQVPTLTNSPYELEQLRSEIRDMNQNINSLAEGVEIAERTVHEHSILISGLQEDLPTLFKDNFDPFQQKVERDFENVNSKLEVHSSEVARLEQQILDLSSVQSPQGRFLEEVNGLKEETALLRVSVTEETTARNHDTQETRRQLGLKADTLAMNNQMDTLKHAFRGLHDQYSNITTDELYQRMVHWFQQSYPSAANLFQQLTAIRQEVHQLQGFNNQITWIQSRSQDLTMLLNQGPQLQSLLHNAAELQQLPELITRADKSSADANSAIAKVEAVTSILDEQAKQVENIQGALAGLRSVVHSLPTSFPFAKTEDINAIEQVVEDLGSRIDKGLADERQARIDSSNEMRTTSGNEHEQRVKVEQQLKTSLNQLSKNMAMFGSRDAIIDELPLSVKGLEAKLSQLRKDFDGVNQDYVEPNIWALGGERLAPMIVTMAQVQNVLDSINQALITPLKYVWTYDLNAAEAPGDHSKSGNNDSNGISNNQDRSIGNGKGKGKSKQ